MFVYKMTLHQLFDHLIPEEKRPLGLLIVLSLMIHVGAFFVFKTKPYYPKVIRLTPPQASLIQLNTTGSSGKILAWIELFDPSVIALPSKQPDVSAVKKFSPDLSDASPKLESPVPLILAPTDLAPFSNLIPSLAERAAQSIHPFIASPMPLVVETPPALSGTDLQFTGSLAKRKIIHRVPLPPAHTTSILLRPTILRIAVDQQGIVVYALVDESSGDSATDLLASQTLKNWRFESVESQTPLQWGRVTVFWDIQPPAKTSEKENSTSAP